jgi:hypothetical protein
VFGRFLTNFEFPTKCGNINYFFKILSFIIFILFYLKKRKNYQQQITLSPPTHVAPLEKEHNSAFNDIVERQFHSPRGAPCVAQNVWQLFRLKN